MPSERKSPWSAFFYALIFLVIGVGGYLKFRDLEKSGGRERLPAIAILVYKAVGKTGVLAVFGGLSAICALAGIARLAAGKAPENQTADTKPTAQ
jgi:hypothetical protein